jgi:hypothetical protein
MDDIYRTLHAERTGAQRPAALVLAALAGLVAASSAFGQANLWPTLEVNLGWDSGMVDSPPRHRIPAPGQPVVVYSTEVDIPGSAWLQLRFDEVSLAGMVEEGNGAWLRLTSLHDGGQQLLNSAGLGQWASLSAFFNGSAVRIELLAHPDTSPSRFIIAGALVGLPGGSQARLLCDGTDDRVLSDDPRAARRAPGGCTQWLFNDTNRMFISAGHCPVGDGHAAHFNVPLSTSAGTPMMPPPEHQYAVQGFSVQRQDGGLGADWMYFACWPNSNTGLTAYQAQGARHTLATSAPLVASPPQQIRLTGYGTVSEPIPLTWNEAQKTGVGTYALRSGNVLGYRVDVTGGNSGSALVDESTGMAIGIATHGGCDQVGYNHGTAVNNFSWQSALNAPRGLARSGRGIVSPPLYAIGDAVNNFGTLNLSPGVMGNFAKISEVAPWMQGLAYDPAAGLFHAVNHNPFSNVRQLYTVHPATGQAMLVAAISGTSAVINGLGFDPSAGILYGISQADGQLFTIGTSGASAGAALPVGAPGGGTIAGLEYSPFDQKLYGLDRSTTPARLVRIDTQTGQQTVIGALGGDPPVSNVSGLAVVNGGDLYTLDAATGRLVRIDPATGAATVLNDSGGTFGAAYGMSAVITPTSPCYANCDGSTTPPILNVEDFSCFINRFAEAQGLPHQQQLTHYANCDQSTTPPVLNVEDFSCFINRFAAGCP